MKKAKIAAPYALMVLAIVASLMFGYNSAPKAAAAEGSKAYSGFDFAVQKGGEKRAITAGPGFKTLRLKNSCSDKVKVLIRDSNDQKDLGAPQILDPRNTIIVRGELIYIQSLNESYASVEVLPVPNPE